MHPATELCLELLAPHHIAKSEYVLPGEISGHTFQFTFAEKLPESITLRIHQLKSLNHSILSEFLVKLPEEGRTEHS
jgi:hypothetical protein